MQRLLSFIVVMALSGLLNDVHAQGVAVDVSESNLQTESSASTASPRLAAMKEGEVQIVVRLKDAPLAVANGSNNKRLGGRLTPDQQRAYLSQLKQQQDALMGQIAALGGRELARVSKAHNALMVAIDASSVSALKKIPGVAAIRPVLNYELALTETVPYISAASVQAAGLTGAGIKVAVLDTGIDYTHRNLGGPGTEAAYMAAYGISSSDPKNTTRDGLFPTAKVVEGFDFVGEVWPSGPLAFDHDPIDFEGHGTHVADIIGGLSTDGLHKGVAPGAALLAIKTCSAVSSACSGIALLLGMDFAVDPNGDGEISDAVDVINMSLGQDYGQREDDLSQAAANATHAGILVVAAAGNAGDRPYITGSPATTPQVLSVAQTQVPSAMVQQLKINSPAAIAGLYPNTATVSWAPIGAGFTGNVAWVGRGCPAGSISPGSPADPYLDNPAGKVALIDRGACNISPKVERAAQAGAIGVLLAQNVAGDATSFGYGGGAMFVPTLVITQSVGTAIKTNLLAPVNVTVSSAFVIPLVGSMVSSSSRGPGYSYNTIKPDIGAPGASVSAVAGSGSDEEPFGGTSGATPMVAGSAALVLQALELEGIMASPTEVKARLMNTAETNIFINPAAQPGVLAPIARIGGGEVRVGKAVSAWTAAWDAGDPASVGLSLGFHRLIGMNQAKKKVLVRNYSATTRTYSVVPSFRYANDAAGGAVTLSAPHSITVPANGSSTFVLTATVNANLLPPWNLNGGSLGGRGDLLQGLEFDGYVTLSDPYDTIRLPWHILPYKAASVRPAATNVTLSGGTGSLALTNAGGAVAGPVSVFSLTGTSPQLPAATLPRPGDNFAIIDLKSVGARVVNIGTSPSWSGNLGVQFAINTYGQRAHPNYPAEFDVFIDINRDGIDDFALFTAEFGGFGASGQNLVAVFNFTTSAVSAFFFTDVDLNSANSILTAPLSAVGLTPSTQFDFTVVGFDNYFTGVVTDVIPTMTYRLDTPRFTGTGVPASGVPVNGSSTLSISEVPGGAAQSPSQTGLLLMYRNARTGVEADAVTITP